MYITECVTVPHSWARRGFCQSTLRRDLTAYHHDATCRSRVGSGYMWLNHPAHRDTIIKVLGWIKEWYKPVIHGNSHPWALVVVWHLWRYKGNKTQVSSNAVVILKKRDSSSQKSSLSCFLQYRPKNVKMVCRQAAF